MMSVQLNTTSDDIYTMSADTMGDAILDAIFRQKTRLVRFYMRR
jgi:hypothetical protein